jgi:DNA invertase Pin-like site-specific DNA recombinase
MAKAIIWCRVSTTQQEFDSQKKDLINKAIRDGFKDEADRIVIGEAGASAIKMNEVYQKEVNKLIETIDTIPGVTTIYVWEVSRLARNEIAFYQMKDKIIKSKIQLICNVPQIKLLDDNGEVNHGMEITLNLLVTLAKQEMEIKMKRFDRGRRRKAAEGKWTGGTLSYGYTIDYDRDKLIVVDERKAENVRRIFNLYESGFSQAAIAKDFFERGITEVSLHQINRILNNERYTGKMMIHDGTIERAFPAIITQEQYDECRKIADKNNLTLSKAKNIYYGDHIVKCYKCGRYCVVQGVMYHCYDAFNRLKKYNNFVNPENCDNHLCISVNVMESLLWHVAIEVETEYILHSAEKDRKLYQNKIDDLRAKFENIDNRLTKCDNKRKRVRDVYLDGDMTIEERDKRYQKIEMERREILDEKLEYQNDIRHYEELIENVFSKYSFDDVKSIEGNLEQIMKLSQQIAGITDDKERSEIVHRHFKKITFEDATIEVDFKIGRKKTKASFIKIYLYNDTVLYYFFVPNNGRNGGYFKADSEGNVLGEIFPEYQRRFMDKGKIRRREEGRKVRREYKEENYPKEKGYLYGVKEIAELLEVRWATARFWVSPDGPCAKITKRIGRNIVVQREELIDVLSKFSSKQAREASERARKKIESSKTK